MICYAEAGIQIGNPGWYLPTRPASHDGTSGAKGTCMSDKILLNDIKAALKEDEAEETELEEELKNLTKLKASLEKATAVIKSKEKDFSDASE